MIIGLIELYLPGLFDVLHSAFLANILVIEWEWCMVRFCLSGHPQTDERI